MFQRKRSVSFGGYGWWVPFLSLPALLLGAWGCARSFFFFPAVASKEEEPWHCGRVPLRQSPSRCPVPAGACGSRDRPSSPPRRALWEPCGCQALRGPPWGLVVGSHGHVACKRVLWFPPPTPLTAEDLLPTPPLPGLQSSRPPSAPHGKVPPGPRHVPSAISISRSCPRSVCARQSTTAAACTPGSEGLFASRVLIYRGTV